MKIKFKSIKMKNFLSYGNSVTEFNFKEGLNLIAGSNGSGKSSFALDVLCYNLYGSAYRSINLNELINNKNGSKLWTECTFEKDNSVYRIERGMKPSVLKIFKDDLEQDLLSHKDLIQQTIDSILGINHSLFKQIVSLSILNNKPFLTLPKADKTNLLESIFNIKIFGKMLKIVKKNFTEIKSSLDLSDKELELYKQNLQTFVNQIKTFQKSKEEFDEKKKNDLIDIELKLNVNQGHLKAITDKIKALDFKEIVIDPTDKNNLETKLDKIQKSLSSCSSKRHLLEDEYQFLTNPEHTFEEFEDRYFERIKPKIKDILEKNQNIEKEKLVCKSTLEKVNQEKTNSLNSQISDIENQIKVLTKDKTFLTKDYLEKNLEEVIKLNNALNTHKLDIGRIKEDLQKLEKGEGVCDYCKQSINDEHKELEVSTRKEKIKSLLVDIEKLKSEIEVLISKHIKEKNSIIESKVEKLKSEIEVLKKQIQENKEKLDKDVLDKVLELNKQQVDLQAERSSIAIQEIKSIKDNLKNQIKENEKAIHILIDDEKKIKNSLSELEQKEKTHTSNKSEFEKLEIQRVNLEDNLKDWSESSKKLSESKFSVDIEELKKDFEKKKINFQELKVKNGDLKKKIQVNDVIKDVLSEEGIKKFFFSRLIPELNKSINTYLDFFELPVRFEFDSEFEYKIDDFGNVRSYQSFSAGERFRIDLSIILAFIQLNKLINSCDINLLMLDELLDVGIDTEGMDLVLEKLKELTEKENLCSYIISHKGIENNMYIDHVVNIKKINGFSKIEV